MSRLLPVLLVGAALLAVRGSGSDVAAKNPAPAAGGLPVGKWKVEFSNGVSEVVEIGNGGESSVDEPLRRSGGTAEVKDKAVVITFADDRVERWTPVGQRFVVEHWFPGSRVPVVTPVLGIAERAP